MVVLCLHAIIPATSVQNDYIETAVCNAGLSGCTWRLPNAFTNAKTLVVDYSEAWCHLCDAGLGLESAKRMALAARRKELGCRSCMQKR